MIFGDPDEYSCLKKNKERTIPPTDKGINPFMTETFVALYTESKTREQYKLIVISHSEKPKVNCLENVFNDKCKHPLIIIRRAELHGLAGG